MPAAQGIPFNGGIAELSNKDGACWVSHEAAPGADP